MVRCRRSRWGLTSRETDPPSPTKQMRPQVSVQRTAARRASALPLQSMAVSAPLPPVRS